jgi:hypothetical protein
MYNDAMAMVDEHEVAIPEASKKRWCRYDIILFRTKYFSSNVCMYQAGSQGSYIYIYIYIYNITIYIYNITHKQTPHTGLEKEAWYDKQLSSRLAAATISSHMY